MLRPATPGLALRHDRADAGGGHLVMQGQEVRITPFGCQQRRCLKRWRALPGGALRLIAGQAPLFRTAWRSPGRQMLLQLGLAHTTR